MKVLVTEKLADRGVDLLRGEFEVDVLLGLGHEELLEGIGAYDGLIIRSATKVTAEVIERADNLKAIGRAGIGVDNIDVEAATKRGILVANAPASNTVAASTSMLSTP
ncbi:MAG: phosphoglycerate dehydrogenase, partial [Actinobacteria bacterium]|nr:phosphoglycerate dehydrogenase [Actinomycetota bacterium]